MEGGEKEGRGGGERRKGGEERRKWGGKDRGKERGKGGHGAGQCEWQLGEAWRTWEVELCCPTMYKFPKPPPSYDPSYVGSCTLHPAVRTHLHWRPCLWRGWAGRSPAEGTSRNERPACMECNSINMHTIEASSKHIIEAQRMHAEPLWWVHRVGSRAPSQATWPAHPHPPCPPPHTTAHTVQPYLHTTQAPAVHPTPTCSPSCRAATSMCSLRKARLS